MLMSRRAVLGPWAMCAAVDMVVIDLLSLVGVIGRDGSRTPFDSVVLRDGVVPKNDTEMDCLLGASSIARERVGAGAEVEAGANVVEDMMVLWMCATAGSGKV